MYIVKLWRRWLVGTCSIRVDVGHGRHKQVYKQVYLGTAIQQNLQMLGQWASYDQNPPKSILNISKYDIYIYIHNMYTYLLCVYIYKHNQCKWVAGNPTSTLRARRNRAGCAASGRCCWHPSSAALLCFEIFEVPRDADCGGREVWLWYGYGSIPIDTIFRGMNIHLPAILGFTRYQGFDPSQYSCNGLQLLQTLVV